MIEKLNESRYHTKKVCYPFTECGKICIEDVDLKEVR